MDEEQEIQIVGFGATIRKTNVQLILVSISAHLWDFSKYWLVGEPARLPALSQSLSGWAGKGVDEKNRRPKGLPPEHAIH